jgi:ketosteroid isomerase-like protein
MDETEARAFADAWIAAWNAHDLDAVLAHYADDVEFRSPVASAITGEPSGVVHGRDALRRYWSAGLERVLDLHFELLELAFGIDAVALRYRNQAGRVVTEIVEFADGRVVRAAAFYGEADVLRAVGAA